jgi:hypothetical protein
MNRSGPETIPGVGPSLAAKLTELGYRTPADLESQGPERMYEHLCELRGTAFDRCVVYVFRCAVSYVNDPERDPEKLKWWYWKD